MVAVEEEDDSMRPFRVEDLLAFLAPFGELCFCLLGEGVDLVEGLLVLEGVVVGEGE